MKMKMFPMVKYRTSYNHIIAENVKFIFRIEMLREPFNNPNNKNYIPSEAFYFAPIVSRWADVVVDEGRWIVTLKRGMGSDGTSAGLDWIEKLRRGAFVHDAGYHLMKQGVCRQDLRPVWDYIAYLVWIDSGVWKWLAASCHKGLQIGGGPAALPKNKRPIIYAK